VCVYIAWILTAMIELGDFLFVVIIYDAYRHSIVWYITGISRDIFFFIFIL